MRKEDGTFALPKKFDVQRGVVQGAIDSPWYFILAMELLSKEADGQGGVDLN
eukprot:COSAG02_NODE_9427_length_2219_cov_7.830889_1_plen_52_part_00